MSSSVFARERNFGGEPKPVTKIAADLVCPSLNAGCEGLLNRRILPPHRDRLGDPSKFCCIELILVERGRELSSGRMQRDGKTARAISRAEEEA